MRMIDADALIEWIDENVSENTPYALVTKAVVISALKSKNVTQTVGGWISVKDRLPDKAGIYIICDHYGNVMSRHFCKQHGRFAGYWHFNGSAKYGNPLYWMPLPEPPEVEA